MKLERLHESVLMTVVIIFGLCLAVAAGSFAGSGRFGPVGMIVGAIIVLIFLLVLRERVWMLIPAVWMLGGKISLLPLPFTVAHLGVLFAFGVFLLLKAFKIIRLKPKWGLVEVWMLVVLLYLVTVFIRNPVGVEALGSQRVGGRPYFNVAVACAAFWVLSRSVASARDAFFLPLLVVAGHAFQTAINVLAYRVPSTIGFLSKIYSGLSAAEDQQISSGIPGEGLTRFGYWQGTATSTFLAACSYWRPFTFINPIFFGRFLIFCFAMFAVLQSGFRSALFGMALVFLVSSYFRRGWIEVARGVVLGFVALGLLLALQGRIFDLPFSAQRALSFLPGKWDYMAKSEARGSTEWRIEMWKAMLIGNKYIGDKWLGDGFGFTRQQLQVMEANQTTATTADQQENFLISGTVHSGPISAIRFVGYVGLILFLVLLTLVAIRAVRLIRRAEGTPFYPMALFVCIPSIVHPFMYVLIFGAYDGDLPNAILAIGLQKMLENSLDASKTEPVPAATSSIPRTARFRHRPQLAPARRSIV